MATPSIAIIPSAYKEGVLAAVLPAPVYGEELVTNGDFSDGSTGWNAELGWSISDERAYASTTSGGRELQSSAAIPIPNRNYLVSYEIVSIDNGSLKCRIGDTFGDINNSVGVKTQIITASSNAIFRFLNHTTVCNATIDNVSVKEVIVADADLDFTRGSTATRINAQGLIEEVGVNVPRLDYSDGGCPSLLLEPQSRNLLTYSEDFSQWNKGLSTTISPNYAISPDGTQNATRIQTPMGIGTYLSLAASMTIGSIYTLALYLKNNGGENIDIGVSTSSSVGAKTASIEVNLTNEWVRYELSFTADSNSNFVFIDNINNANAIDCLVWGAQLEEQSYATSYIPNYGTAEGITRLADSASKTGLSSYINSVEGVLFFEGNVLSNSTGTARRISLLKNGTSQQIRIEYTSASNQIFAVLYDGTTNQCFISHTLSNSLSNNKIAFKYKENDFSLYVNGVKVGTDLIGTTLTSGNLDTLTLYAFSNYFYGNCKDLRVYNTALTDAELIELTTI